MTEMTKDYEGDEISALDLLVMMMRTVSQDARYAAIRMFCQSCGSENAGCQCWNDE